MVGVTSSYQQVVIPSMTANTPAQIVGPTGGRIYITGISIDVPASATVTISQGLASDALTALLPVPTDMLTPANASEFAYYAVSARGNGLWITSTQNVSTPTVIQFYSDELISTLPTTATPTLNAPSSGYIGETVTVSIANLASYAAGTTIGVNAAGEYAIAGANISWRLPGGATTRSLSVTAQEPGKKLSLAASVSLTINTYGYPQTVPPTGGGNINPPLTPTTTPTLSVSTLTGQVGSNQNLTITNYNAAFTYRLETTAGSAIRSGSSIAWTLPGSAGNATLTVYATESGKSESAGAACVATVNAVGATATPTLGAPSSGSINAGQSVTIQITNWGSYTNPSTTFTKFHVSDSVTVNGSGLITWTPGTAADNQTLGVQVTDAPSSISAVATSGEVDVAAAATQTPAPILSGFPSSANEGTTVTGTIVPTGGGSYTSPSYEFSLNGGTSWSPVTGSSAVRVSGNTVSFDLPNTAGDNNTVHTLRMRVTQAGSTVSNASNTVSVTANAVLVLPTVVPASMTRVTRVYAFDRMVEGYTGNTVRLRRTTDNVEQDFGFNALGYLDIPAIHTWRAGSAVNFVWFIDQEGSGVTHPNANLTYPQFMAADGSMSWLGTNRDENTGVLSLAPGTGAPGLRLDTALLRTTNSGLTTNNGIEFTYLYTCLDRVIGNVADAASLGGINTRQAIASYGTSADNRLLWQFNNGTSPERLSHQGAATGAGGAAVTFGTQTSLKIKRFAQRIVSFGVHPTMTASGALTGGPGQQYLYTRGQMGFNASNAANIAGLPAMANGTMETCGEVFSTRAAARIILGAIIVSETLLPAERQLLQCRLNEYGQRHKTATLAQMNAWWEERVDFRDVNVSTGRVTGKQSLLALDFNQTAGNNWNLQAVDPQSGFGGVECPVGQGTNPLNTFLATTNYFSDAREYTIAFLGRGYHNNINLWMSLHDPSITDGDARPVIYLGRDHNDAVFGASVSPPLDPNGISGDYGGGDGNLGTISQSMGKYGHKLSNRQWNSNNVTVTTAFTFKPEYGGQTFNVGDTLTVAQFTAAAGVQGPTPELRTYTQAERQWYPLDIGNRLELLIVTLRPNPAYDYAANYAARRNLIKTAQQQLFVAVPGVPLGHIDSDSAQALRNHSHGTGTERWRSSNYQAGGRFMEGIYNHAWFARRALTQNEIESFANSFWKYYAA